MAAGDRRDRLQKWLSLLGCDISVLTGLIPDLILIATDYLVSLEHMWSALPRYLRRTGSVACECMSAPSNTLTACKCFRWISQHVCSIHTLGQAATSEFSIKLTDDDNVGSGWWIGILWSTSVDGFQPPTSPTTSSEPHDSFDNVAGLDSVMLSHLGHIQRFGTRGSYGRKITPWGTLPASPLITLRIINVGDGEANSETSSAKSFIEFSIKGYVPARIQIDRWDEARAFVQFDRYRLNYFNPTHTPSHPPICTIQTPLFPSAHANLTT
jgi:hypothetical protein